jgi:hypothetical protein
MLCYWTILDEKKPSKKLKNEKRRAEKLELRLEKPRREREIKMIFITIYDFLFRLDTENYQRH